MAALIDAGCLIGTVVAMEAVAAGVHRWVMHGWGWRWHRSHHEAAPGLLETNDLYAVVFSAAATLLFVGSPLLHAPSLWWVGLGMTVYGVLYVILHDGLVHRRWPLRLVPRQRYLQRLVQAHHLHHATHSRDGAVSFGFLYAPPVPVVRARLRHLQAHR